MAELSEDQRVGRNTQTESSKCHEQRFVDPLSFYSSNKVHVHTRLADFGRLPLNSSTSNLLRRELLARGYRRTLDRVNELEGHSGCVNALSWAHDGRMLLSGGDDTTVRLWRMDSESDNSQSFPFKCDAVLRTPHTGNIFNAQLLPGSARIATAAADGKVCVLDAERAMTTSVHGREKDFNSSETCIRILRCHKYSTKRIVTEGSSDLFLSVAEDGAVRQHDLRVRHHQCNGRSTNCPAPLLKLPHELSALALSPLTPWNLVVAGESPYGYLFDRRQAGRILQDEWGVPCGSGDFVTCVRRFARINKDSNSDPRSDHITGARMAKSNGHEVLLNYSTDAVYLFSTRDEPTDSVAGPSAILKPNNDRQNFKHPRSHSQYSFNSQSSSEHNEADESLDEEALQGEDEYSGGTDESRDDNEEEEEEDIDDALALETKFRAPVILPRARYAGARNAETVKDVNFIGPIDEFVSSGSDDGNFFLWEKSTTKVHGIYEGDGSIVNVIEGHPELPLLAVSGIDHTVKLFTPTGGNSLFSRMNRMDQIIERNMTPRNRHSRFALRQLVQQYRMVRGISQLQGEDSDNDGEECTYQ